MATATLDPNCAVVQWPKRITRTRQLLSRPAAGEEDRHPLRDLKAAAFANQTAKTSHHADRFLGRPELCRHRLDRDSGRSLRRKHHLAEGESASRYELSLRVGAMQRSH